MANRSRSDDSGQRLDVALVARGLARSRGQAKDLIASGKVSVDGAVCTKRSAVVDENAVISAETDPWVSRAAHKLLGALQDSGITPRGTALDAGASTGGFTQVLLARGAQEVYSVDVGHGQLAEAVRSDPRVHNREGINLKDLTDADVDGKRCDCAVVDVSFISATQVLAPILAVMAADADVLVMVKPQFEVGRGRVRDSRGVVSDPHLREEAIARVIDCADQLGWECFWRGESRLTGENGNLEEFVALRKKFSTDLGQTV